MRRHFALLFLLALCSFSGPVPARAEDGALTLRRFALLVGSNAGSATRKELRYAVTDARAVSRVLRELGGVRTEDETLLENPDPLHLEHALREQAARIAQSSSPAQRTEFVFYYSGHSDELGLRLGETLVPYVSLRAWLEQIRATVRIVVLDSCASGAFTRAKGGVQVSPFLFDESIDVQGQAVLTASSDNEVAQESDRLGGSFFTYALLSGLRGAADVGGDGRITLSEAYRYAFDETLARTGLTQSGAQHPSYDIRLSGSGDLVMTDLRASSAQLELAPEVEGRVFVRNGTGQLLAEQQKRKGQRTLLAMPTGSYSLLLERGTERREARITLASATHTRVGADMFAPISVEMTRSRGESDAGLLPVGLSLLPPYDNYGSDPKHTNLALHALYGEPAELSGLAFALVGNGVTRTAEGLTFALGFNRTNDANGVAFAVLANANRTHMVGLSFAGLFNLDRGEREGILLSLGINSARKLKGFSFAPLNITREDHVGLSVGGMQFARSLRGLAIGGITTAEEVRGVQLGILNVTSGDVHGAQIGLINYARSADAGIAPFSITRDGGVHAQLVSGALAAIQMALRFDARYTYSFFGVGVHPSEDPRAHSYLFGGGFGGKIPIVRMLSSEVDLAGYLAQPLVDFKRGVPCSAVELRALFRLEFHKQLSLLAGPTFYTLINRDPKERIYPGFSAHATVATHPKSEIEVRYAPGWVVGLRF